MKVQSIVEFRSLEKKINKKGVIYYLINFEDNNGFPIQVFSTENNLALICKDLKLEKGHKFTAEFSSSTLFLEKLSIAKE